MIRECFLRKGHLNSLPRCSCNLQSYPASYIFTHIESVASILQMIYCCWFKSVYYTDRFQKLCTDFTFFRLCLSHSCPDFFFVILFMIRHIPMRDLFSGIISFPMINTVINQRPFLGVFPDTDSRTKPCFLSLSIYKEHLHGKEENWKILFCHCHIQSDPAFSKMNTNCVITFFYQICYIHHQIWKSFIPVCICII